MALSAATVLEVEQAGSDTNGGGFVTGASGTDWSQQTSPQYSVTDGVTAGSTTITSATAAFGTDVVGNLISVSGGTGSVTQGWYQITARGSATSITVDRSTGLTSGTGVTLKIGGALATWGQMSALLTVAGQKAWIKYSATAYSMSTVTANVSGGIVSLAGAAMSVEGYEVTRGDRTGNQPQLTWASVAAPGSITYMFTSGGSRKRLANLLVNGNSVNNVGGFNISGSAGSSAIQCTAENCNGTSGVGFLGFVSAIGAKSCQANTCITGFSVGDVFDCYATGCTTGFLNTSMNVKCLAASNTNGFSSNVGSLFDRCTADSNTTAGFVVTGNTSFVDCLSSNQSGGGGIGFSVGSLTSTMDNCASYNNTTEISGTPYSNKGMILNASFSGQPYVTPGSDFRLNATAGAGALLRGAGIGVFGQTDNSDIGAVQHTDPSGGGGNTYIFQVES